MPYLASAGGYRLQDISGLASVLERGAARNRSNDATVALNNVLRDNFNAEKQMALNALTAMDNKYRADLTDKRLRDLAEEKRKSEQRAALAQIAMGDSGGGTQQESNIMNDVINQLNFGQRLRNAARNENNDYGFNLVNELEAALTGIPRPKNPNVGSSGSVTLVQPTKTAPSAVTFETLPDATKQFFELVSKTTKSKTNNQ